MFQERLGFKISVDRLSMAPQTVAKAVAMAVAQARGATFYGWAVIAASDASDNGRKVHCTPQLDNPYHADIELPELARHDSEAQKQHAQELADASRWQAAEVQEA